MRLREFQRLTGVMRRKLKVLVTRGLVRLVDPSALLQSLQVEITRGELLDAVEHWEGYGRTAHAPAAGREALTVAVGAERAHTAAVAVTNRQFRVRNLAEGEQVLYDDQGNVIWFKRDRILIDAVDHVEIKAPSCHIEAITTHDGNVTINGNLVVNGDTQVSGTATVTGAATVGALAATGAAGASSVTGGLGIDGVQFGTHKHTGVQTGTSQTGGPV